MIHYSKLISGFNGKKYANFWILILNFVVPLKHCAPPFPSSSSFFLTEEKKVSQTSPHWNGCCPVLPSGPPKHQCLHACPLSKSTQLPWQYIKQQLLYTVDTYRYSIGKKTYLVVHLDCLLTRWLCPTATTIHCRLEWFTIFSNKLKMRQPFWMCFRTLNPKFQKNRTKTEAAPALPCLAGELPKLADRLCVAASICF